MRPRSLLSPPRNAARTSVASPTRSARWAWAGVCCGLLGGLVSQAPATWLARAVADASEQRLLLNAPEGTVWQGSAQWVLSSGPTRSGVPAASDVALPSRMRWQLSPGLSLSQGLVLRLTLTSDCCTPQPLHIQLSPLWRGVQVRVEDHQSHWPAHWLVGLGAPWNTVQPDGSLQLSTRRMQWRWQAGQERLDGEAELQLQQFATRLSTLRPLGSYRLVLSGGDTMAVTLDTLEGRLQLVGKGQFTQHRLQFRGEASAQAEFEAALSNLLNILGQRQGAKSILELG